MRDFSDAFLAAYLDAAGPDILSSVGLYRMEELGLQLFDNWSGDHFSILGLPLRQLLAALRAQGHLLA
jgi:septum formation protein